MDIGTPLTSTATKALLLGSGELGKEVAIELQHLGVEVIACDSYVGAPAMQVAHRFHVLNMLDGAALRAVIDAEKPDLVIPEIEAIATDTLAAIEAQGIRVVPTARATRLTMDREGIRRLAAEELGLPTSPYRFIEAQEDLREAAAAIGYPCFIKPVMSSSGKGQMLVRRPEEFAVAWAHAQTAGRAAALSAGGEPGRRGDRGGLRSGARGIGRKTRSKTTGIAERPTRVIVEGLVKFDYEITLLTVRHSGGTTFLDPIGHVQEDGDYRESWQPQPMSVGTLEEAKRIAGTITGALGGWGVFGVEMFVVRDRVLFSEVSPRPHDTGLVTLVSQDLSEFALHARAILGLPIPAVGRRGPSASRAILASGTGVPVFSGLDEALRRPGTDVRLFGKPRVDGHRRVGVALARGETIAEARAAAKDAATAVRIELVP